MNTEQFEQIKRWTGLTAVNGAKLADLGPRMASHIPAIVDHFYERLMAEPQARAVMGSGDQINSLRPLLAEWILELFGGTYDEQYLQKRSRIGRTHVQVKLPQQFMFAGMAVIRAELTQLIMGFELSDGPQKIQTLHCLLDLELGIMLDNYRDSYVDSIREADRQAAQRKMAEIQHMAHIGQLAASVAHEIKNPLAGISGAVQVLSQEMEVSNPHFDVMKEILRQIDRLDSAVKDLLTYARPKQPALVLGNVSNVIRSALTVLSEDPTVKSVTLVCKGMEVDTQAILDPVQFEHVISNLVINAAQACNGEGQVTLTVDRGPQGVEVHIRDNGEGMTGETLRRALEPFYTTKTRGTGLGLPICKRIIDEHHGTMEIESAPGTGTTVTICLPAPDHGSPSNQDEQG